MGFFCKLKQPTATEKSLLVAPNEKDKNIVRINQTHHSFVNSSAITLMSKESVSIFDKMWFMVVINIVTLFKAKPYG